MIFDCSFQYFSYESFVKFSRKEGLQALAAPSLNPHVETLFIHAPGKRGLCLNKEESCNQYSCTHLRGLTAICMLAHMHVSEGTEDVLTCHLLTC